MKVKTIDVQAKEWFDKINGNSYFSGEIIVNFAMPNEKRFKMPFQYGYGEQYIQEAGARLVEHNMISKNHNEPLWCYCDKNNIPLRTSKQNKCLKRDVVAYGRAV